MLDDIGIKILTFSSIIRFLFNLFFLLSKSKNSLTVLVFTFSFFPTALTIPVSSKPSVVKNLIFLGTSFSVSITSIALNYALLNNANIEIVDPDPVDLNLNNIKYHKMKAAEYIKNFD